MTLDEMRDLSNRLTYQGNACFRITEINWRDRSKVPKGFIYVSVWVWAVDVNPLSVESKKGRRCKIESGSIISLKEIEGMDEASCVYWIRDTLIMLSLHEIGETLKLDNTQIFNPHKLPTVTITEESEAA